MQKGLAQCSRLGFCCDVDDWRVVPPPTDPKRDSEIGDFWQLNWRRGKTQRDGKAQALLTQSRRTAPHRSSVGSRHFVRKCIRRRYGWPRRCRDSRAPVTGSQIAPVRPRRPMEVRHAITSFCRRPGIATARARETRKRGVCPRPRHHPRANVSTNCSAERLRLRRWPSSRAASRPGAFQRVARAVFGA